MAQAVTRNIMTRGRSPLGGLALLVLLLVPASAQALTQPRLRDLADPVPPGGILPYRITLADVTPPVPPLPMCFNPPAECVTLPVTCFNPPPACAGNPTAGFICQNSGNDGANCGVGAPPVADPTLCIPRATPSGVCNGGPNNGLQCTVPDGVLTTQCPGFTFLCERAFNQGAYCGTAVPLTPECVGDETAGFFCRNAENDGASCATEDGSEGDPALCQPVQSPPPRAENGFCLSNPAGICSGGPLFNTPCDTPHGQTSVQCPPATTPPVPSDITVELPLPPGTTFVDADNGGTSSGSIVTWTVPPLTTCGGSGELPCPQLNARLLIDALVPEGTTFQNTATATDADGFIVSAPHLTTVARFLVRALTLSYPPLADDRDRFTYRSLFTLLATEDIDPANEEFRFNVSTPDGTLVEFVLAPGQLPESSLNVWTFSSREPGLKSVRLRQVGPAHYALRLRAARMTLPDVTNLNVTVTITIGDVTLTHDARLLTKRGGRRFVAARSTTTTTIVSAPTTTTSSTIFVGTTSTSLPGATTTSSTLATTTSSTTLDTSTTSTTLDTTTTSTTLDTTTTSTTLDTTTTSTTLDTTTTSTTLDTTTTSTTLDTTTTSTTLDTTTTSTTLDTTTTSSTLDTTTTSSTIDTTTTSTTSTTVP